MSTKFRQCFIVLCDDCRGSTKNQRSDVVFFGKDQTVKHIMGVSRPVGGRTISTTEKVISQQANGSPYHPEKKSLLINDRPIPISESQCNCADYLDRVI
jgi:hypothetical protein